MIQPITSAWGVGLYSCRGQSSKTFVYEAVQHYARQRKPVTVIFCVLPGFYECGVTLH